MYIIPSINILNTSLSDGDNTILAQLGDVINNQSYYNDAQWMQHVGFASLPPVAVAGQSASEAMIYHTTERDYVFASRDYNSQNKYGSLQPGETCLYGAGTDGKAQGKCLINKDGQIILSTTTTNTDSGQPVSFSVKPDSVSINTPWGSLVFSQSGIYLSGNVVKIDSSLIQLGPQTGAFLPSTTSPLPGAPSPPYSQSGSSTVFVGV